MLVQANRRRASGYGRTKRSAEPWCGSIGGNADTAYAFNGAALEIFQHAREHGVRCVLDQTAAPWRYNTQLLAREQARWPGWEECPADMDPGGHMMAREEAEWELADQIVCGSPFVVEAIRSVGGPIEKSRVVPYPVPDIAPLLEVRSKSSEIDACACSSSEHFSFARVFNTSGIPLVAST